MSTNDSSDKPARGLFRRKPKSDQPKKDGRLKQIWSVFQMTRRQNPNVVWWMLLAFVGVILVALLVGLWWGHPVYTTILGVALGLLAAMFILARMAERAAFANIDGQPGAVGAALGTLRRGWAVEEQPVAIDPRTQDVVFRAIGRGGVVLVSEGPSHRATKLLGREHKKTARVLPNVPIHLLQGGNAEGQIPLRKLPSTVTKIKPQLTKAEVIAIRKRLTALGNSAMPIPKGIDPMRARPDRKAMKGR